MDTPIYNNQEGSTSKSMQSIKWDFSKNASLIDNKRSFLLSESERAFSMNNNFLLQYFTSDYQEELAEMQRQHKIEVMDEILQNEKVQIRSVMRAQNQFVEHLMKAMLTSGKINMHIQMNKAVMYEMQNHIDFLNNETDKLSYRMEEFISKMQRSPELLQPMLKRQIEATCHIWGKIYESSLEQFDKILNQSEQDIDEL